MPSVKVVLFKKDRPLSNGEFQIMVRVIINKKIAYKTTNASCSAELWDRLYPPAQKEKTENRKKRPLTPSEQKKKLEISSFVSTLDSKAKKALMDCVSVGTPITHERLFELIFPKPKDEWVFKNIENTIKNLRNIKHIGNAEVYENLLRMLKKFRKDKDLLFTDLTVKLINEFDYFLRERDLRDSSISTYMRTLRAVINKAIEEGICPIDSYPFKKYKVQKLKATSRKIAISKSDLIKISNLNLDQNAHLFHTKNYFLLSYFLRGINFVDLAKLKWTDIIDGRISYVRTKTGKAYSIALLEPALEIISYYEKINSDSIYILPILHEKRHKTVQSQMNRVRKIRTRVNLELKEIAKMVGIRDDITTYVSRHSWATIMKYEGVSIEVIQEGMGHSDSATTQIYLKDFEHNVVDEESKKALLKI